MICKVCGYRINGGLNGCFCPHEDSLTAWLNSYPEPPLIRPLYYRFSYIKDSKRKKTKWHSWNQLNHYAEWQLILKKLRNLKDIKKVDLFVEYKMSSGEIIKGISQRDV